MIVMLEFECYRAVLCVCVCVVCACVVCCVCVRMCLARAALRL